MAKPKAVMTSIELRLRTCIGCRQRCEQDKLFRCVYGDRGAVIDRIGAGRGAWLCGVKCAQQALRTGAYAKAWRVEVDQNDLGEMIRSEVFAGTERV
ncbi:MAG: YlxR family protein [Actinomycetota bacterium]|nr:YlxR family protein [Actinomycetota bacterium]MEC8502650.1 YlxR family protein [Actinomycetota bacterium]